MTPRIHVIGAGLAGLAAAVRLSETPGLEVTLWEATNRAGGRCWSFHDPALDRVIDNGNHLILSGNRAVLDYVGRIGSSDRLHVSTNAAFPFVDFASGDRWTIRIPSRFRDFLRGGAGLPGPSAAAIVDVARLLAAGRTRTVAQALPRRGPLWTRFWEPMTLAILNEPPERASAWLLARVLRETVLRGGLASRPVFAPEGLGPALVDPAGALLRRRGVTFNLRQPLRAVAYRDGRVSKLSFAGRDVHLADGDAVIVAGAKAAGIASGRPPLPPGQTILNAHFRLPPGAADSFPPALGIISGTAHWIFRRGDVLSATISAAQACGAAGLPRDRVVEMVWKDIQRAVDQPDLAYQACRLISAPGATWDQSPQGQAERADIGTSVPNLNFAGDFVPDRLPCSLEAAVRSGNAAADHVIAARRRGPSLH